MIRRLAVICLAFFASVQGQAQTIPLTDKGKIEVDGNILHWRDASGRQTLEELQQTTMKPVKRNQSPNFGFDNAAHWFRIDMTNKTALSEWLVEIDFAPLDRIDFYAESDSGWVHKTSGDTLPVSVREIKHRHPLFSFQIPPDQTKSVYLRIQTSSSIQVPVTLWERDTFIRDSFQIQIINGLFYGAMLVMALYQIFLFFSMRNKLTLYYILTLLSMANIIAFFQGYAFLYFYPEKPFLNDILAILSGPLFLLFSTLLTRGFLNLRSFNKWLDNLLLLNLGIDLIIGLLMMIFVHKISYLYHHYFILSHCIIALVSAGYCVYKKYRPALYYLAAWITILVAASIFTLSNLGFLPGYLSTNYTGLMIGCVLQMLFISFALGYRLTNILRENQAAKELELKRNKEENERLEVEVRLRTAKLEEVNRIKDKLFSVVSHDIKGPLSSLKLSLSLAKTGTLTAEEFKTVIKGIDTHMEQTTEFIQNLLQWAKLQLKGEILQPDRLELMGLLEETLSLLEPELQQKHIAVDKSQVHGAYVAYADPNMIRSVMRNLVTNAIKFTPDGGRIAVSAEMHGQQVMISVSDSGVGIPASHMNRIFTLDSLTTMGTKQETGTGLGLILCREFIEKNHGRIWFDHNDGPGTTFHFSLPTYRDENRRDPSSR